MFKIMKCSVLYKALGRLMILSASVHVAATTVYAVVQRDVSVLHYFRLIELDLLFPNILNAPYSWVLATGILLVLYALLVWYTIRNK